MKTVETFVNAIAGAGRDDRHAATHQRDPLTGLYNNFGFVCEGDLALRRMAAAGHEPTVIYIELNDYEGLVSRLGFEDSVLMLNIVRQRLEGAFGDDVMMARFDSERFAILVPRVDHDIAGLVQVLEAPLSIRSSKIYLSLTCGVASYPDAADNMYMLIMAARTARNDALRAGNRFGFFATDLQQRMARQRALEDGLWYCRSGYGMSLVYQPKVDIADGTVVGVEALLRWRHPELGPISPAEFIPLAERTRTIVPIGEWLTREALRQQAQWARQGLRIGMSINVSPLQLQPDCDGPSVLEILSQECTRLDLDRHLVELEITEGLLSDRTVMEQVGNISAAGYGIAIDDFGRDHSALSMLVNCPATSLKIDKSFVDNVTENDRQLTVINFIVGLAKRLGMKTVVEGIEHVQQLVLLAEAGCDYGQGYFYYRPMNGNQIPDLRHKA